MKKTIKSWLENLFQKIYLLGLEFSLVVLLFFSSVFGGLISCGGSNISECIANLIPPKVYLNISIKTLSTSILWPENLIIKANGKSVFNSCLSKKTEPTNEPIWFATKIDDHNLSIGFSGYERDKLLDFDLEVYRLDNCENSSSELLIYEKKSIFVNYEDNYSKICETTNVSSIKGQVSLETVLTK